MIVMVYFKASGRPAKARQKSVPYGERTFLGPKTAMPSIGFYFIAAIVVLILVMMAVPSDGRTLEMPRHDHTMIHAATTVA